MPHTVLFDACVLYPAPLRDLLMWSATRGLVSARWSADILSEWVENLLLNRSDLKRERLERTCAEMNRAVPDALVTGYEALIPSLTLPDLNDRHVLAAAISADVEIILTFNLKDFPAHHLPHGIRAIGPDEFLCEIFGLNTPGFLATMSAHRASLVKPPKTAEEYLATLGKCGLPELVKSVTRHLDQI